MLKPKDYCAAHGFTTSEFIALMKEEFPRYSGAANSMVNHSEESGVTFTSKAVSVLKGTQREKRTRPCKFTFRLLESTGELLRAYAEDEGMSIQTVVETAIVKYLEAEVKT